MGVGVSGCKDDEADTITDPEGDTGHWIGIYEMTVAGPLEEEYLP